MRTKPLASAVPAGAPVAAIAAAPFLAPAATLAAAAPAPGEPLLHLMCCKPYGQVDLVTPALQSAFLCLNTSAW